MSTIKLFKNVPWGSDGLNIVRFPNKTAQDSYFNSLAGTPITEVNYDPRGGAVLNIGMTLTEAREYNYMAWYDDSGNPLYYFVEDYEFLNNNPTVTLSITEDIWQNCQFKAVFNPSKVHRRHMPRWNGSSPILYPIDEGSPRSLSSNSIWKLTRPNNFIPMMMVTSKTTGGGNVESVDNLMYYVTFINQDGTDVGYSSGTGKHWLNPLSSSFLSEFASTGIAISALIGIFILPYISWDYLTVSGNNINYSTGPDSDWSTPAMPDAKAVMVTFATKRRRANWETDYDITVPKPSKGSSSSTASYQYEPQAWADNVDSVVLTDTNGNSLVSIPKNLIWANPAINLKTQYISLSPSLKVTVAGGSPASGLSVAIPLPTVDIPQSNWYDYMITDRTADKRILDNHIRANYYSAAISGVAGTVAGTATGYGYSASFNKTSRSPGLAGVAFGALSGIQAVGSLANAYISDKTDRDNFALNEQKIKNSVAPPLAGSNINGFIYEGIQLVNLTADEVSRRIIASNYITQGVVIDEVMDINLRTRYYYDYIQTRNLSISGALNNTQRLYLETLFNGGVTVWHSETFRGFKYDLDNVEV